METNQQVLQLLTNLTQQSHAGSAGLVRYVLGRCSRLKASQRQQFLQLYSDRVLASRELVSVQLRGSFRQLLQSLDAQEVQGSLLPTAMRLAKR